MHESRVVILPILEGPAEKKGQAQAPALWCRVRCLRRSIASVPPVRPRLYSFSVVTVTGWSSRTVIGVPAGSVAVLRSPAITAAVPPPAPAVAPIAAPFAPPRIAPRIAPPTAAPPTFAALLLPGESPSR